MAFSTLTTQAIPFLTNGTPLDATFAAADTDEGDKVAHSGNPLILHVKVAVAQRTITIVGAVPSNQHQLNDVVMVIPSGEERLMGLEPNQFKDSSGNITITYSDSGANVTVAVYELTG